MSWTASLPFKGQFCLKTDVFNESLETKYDLFEYTMAGFILSIHLVHVVYAWYRIRRCHLLPSNPASLHNRIRRSKPHNKGACGPWCCNNHFHHLTLYNCPTFAAAESIRYMQTLFDLRGWAVRTKWRHCQPIISAGLISPSNNDTETNGCPMSSISEQSRHSFQLLRPLEQSW